MIALELNGIVQLVKEYFFLFMLLFVNVTVIRLLSAKGNFWSVHGYLFLSNFLKVLLNKTYLKIKEFPFDFETDVNLTL